MRPEFFVAIRSPFLWGVVVLLAALAFVASRPIIWYRNSGDALHLVGAGMGDRGRICRPAFNRAQRFVAAGAPLASALFLRLGLNMGWAS
jgi:hypothetical protein